jgi:hypothetical protein
MILRAFRAGVSTSRDNAGPSPSRRRWLGDLALALAGLSTTAQGQSPSKSRPRPKPKSNSNSNDGAGERDVIDRVGARASKAGLGPIGQKPSPHFLAIGDAPPSFLAEALELCEALGKDYLAYFRGHGFHVAYPDRRMTVVALKDMPSFGAYVGEDAAELERQAVGGQYELDTNQLVIFDLRTRRGNLAVRAETINALALVHETIHLLCFNAGMLARDADVPVAISEGLATHGELWRPPRDPKGFGALNRWRLRSLIDARDHEVSWAPLTRLIADDELFFQPKTVDLAYGQAWLLVNFLLKTPRALPKFQAYLAGLPKLGDQDKDKNQNKTGRVAYAEARLGPLATLDQEVRRDARRLLKK